MPEVYGAGIFNCQVFESDYDPYALTVIDYARCICRPVHIHGDTGNISVKVNDVGEGHGRSITEALNDLFGSVNMVKEVDMPDELMPGLPQNKFNGADEDLFGFFTLGQSGYQVIECKWLSGHANRYVVMNPKQTRWSSDRFQSEYNEASYGYNKSAGGYILWLLLGGSFETKVRFYDDYVEGSDLVDRFRMEYKTLEQILREVVFSDEV